MHLIQGQGQISDVTLLQNDYILHRNHHCTTISECQLTTSISIFESNRERDLGGGLKWTVQWGKAIGNRPLNVLFFGLFLKQRGVCNVALYLHRPSFRSICRRPESLSGRERPPERHSPNCKRHPRRCQTFSWWCGGVVVWWCGGVVVCVVCDRNHFLVGNGRRNATARTAR